VAREAHRLGGLGTRHAGHLEQDPPRLDDRDPMVGRALSGAHADLGGFLVTGLSGKTRIQILPPRLTERVIARRAASIWRLVIHAGSWVARPYSPKATV
jgi:hypothetical protein